MICTTETNGNKENINIGAVIIRNTQRMCHLIFFVFVEAIFVPPLTDRYLKNEYQFFDTLKTKDRKIRANSNLLIKVNFYELE